MNDELEAVNPYRRVPKCAGSISWRCLPAVASPCACGWGRECSGGGGLRDSTRSSRGNWKKPTVVGAAVVHVVGRCAAGAEAGLRGAAVVEAASSRRGRLAGRRSATPPPPGERQAGRNSEWRHFFTDDVAPLSMPDKWEYPWFAAWDLAVHMIP
ncbi:MAG: hypothetical protein QM757_15025 [Paludibaculum sp.]